MTYEIRVSERLEKILGKIPQRARCRIVERIDGLAENPRPDDCKKLQGSKHPPLFRIRSGDYRIIYTVEDHVLIVLVLAIGHRRDIYR